MKNFTKIILLILSLSFSLLAKDVATVTAINGEAFIQRDTIKVPITLGITLQEKDTIITGKKAKIQLIFSDETIITIGKNSKFSVNEYLYEDKKEPVAKFSMLKGTMRAITGNIGKIAPEKFTVTAKTATMGIRGTNFSIAVGDNDVTEVYCTFGAITATIDGTLNIVRQGYFISIQPNGGSEIKKFLPKDLKLLKSKFAKAGLTKSSEKNTALLNGTQIDTTTEEFDNILIRDISNILVDSAQINSNINDSGSDTSTLDSEQLNNNINDSGSDTSTLDSEQLNNNINDSGSDTSILDSDLSSIIAGYNMSNAKYNGTYTHEHTIENEVLASSGDAELKVNFGTDKVKLTLTDSSHKNIIFNSDSSISGVNFGVNQTSSLHGQENPGKASGTFNGDTGNNATGTFTITGDLNTNGTFNVTSTQTLK
ncbi:FecR family protein [Arcobacteraceae bacterium]|nr:FecR family protein [Arcobacteraceae bacterium]